MNKTQLREFAISSRVALIESVKLRAYAYGVTEDKVKKSQIVPSAKQLNPSGGLLTNEERAQRDELLRQIEHKGFAQVMEEAAYTWFNRFIAMRYMEVAQLLPIRQRVFARKGEVRPELITDALNVEIDGLDRARVIAFIENNEDEQLYKMQLIALANSLHAVLPLMFEEIDNYTELLFPDGLLQKESVLSKMAALDEDNWQDIEVVGWLYQYYNTELKDETFALLKKNVKITKERIGAATQLFTPKWIVRYMVENSLGRLWLEGHENAALQSDWKYYLPEAEQEPEVAEKLKDLRKDAASLRPEEITVLDPCMGSGHMLVAAFDVLMGIYRSVGYTDRDAVRSIIENNLYGLDIDDRAAQLAYFAVMMRACHYDKRFLRRENVPQPHVCAIQESNRLAEFDNLQGQMSLDKLCLNTANDLIRTFHDAKEYGSILDVQIDGLENAAALMAQLRAIEQPDFALSMWLQRAEKLLPQLALQAEIMQKKYDVVVTNPPYMGSSGMGAKLAQYVKDNYPDSKSDLFAVFIERCGEMFKATGYQAMITQHAWMFLSSFEKLRSKLQQHELVNMAHLGARAFEEIGGEVVQTTSFVMQQTHIKGYRGSYVRLIDFNSQHAKEKTFLSADQRPLFTASQENFAKIPGAPVAYWVSDRIIELYAHEKLMREIVDTKQGLKSSDDKRFFRFWTEIQVTNIDYSVRSIGEAKSCQKKWIPLNKGGTQRWYGDNWYVINWGNDGYEIKAYAKSLYNSVTRTITSMDYYFKECITWPQITSSANFRYITPGFIFNAAGPSMFCKCKKYVWYILGFLNTKIVNKLTAVLNPTVNLVVTDLLNIPFIYDNERIQLITEVVQENVTLSRTDWDSFETSWDFKRHPLIGREDRMIRYNKLRKFKKGHCPPKKRGTRSASSGRMKLQDKHSKGDADHVREDCNTERGSNQGGNPRTCTRECRRNAEPSAGSGSGSAHPGSPL